MAMAADVASQWVQHEKEREQHFCKKVSYCCTNPIVATCSCAEFLQTSRPPGLRPKGFLGTAFGCMAAFLQLLDARRRHDATTKLAQPTRFFGNQERRLHSQNGPITQPRIPNSQPLASSLTLKTCGSDGLVLLPAHLRSKNWPFSALFSGHLILTLRRPPRLLRTRGHGKLRLCMSSPLPRSRNRKGGRANKQEERAGAESCTTQ